VPGERGAQADLGGFGVAHLAHQDHVGVRAQAGAQHARKRQLDLLVDLHLVEPGQAVFDRVFEGRGCPACHGSGYAGRSAVYEMLEMTPALMHLANADDPAGFAAEAQRAFAEHSLKRAVLRLVAEGRTTLAEAMRVGSGV